MAAHIPDFWPEDVGETKLVTPQSLLKEQAAYLGPKTNQLVKAEVITRAPVGANTLFTQSFVLVVPALDNYKYELFVLQHPITLYPLNLVWQNANYAVANQEQFIQKLKEIIGSGKTKSVIEALLAQVSGPSAAESNASQ